MKKTILLFALIGIVFLHSCKNKEGKGSDNQNVDISEVENFLKEYEQKYVELVTAAGEAEWASNTYIVEGDTITSKRVQETQEALYAYTGSKEVIEKIKAYMKLKDQLSPVQQKQLEVMLYKAANFPQTAEELVSERIKAEDAQNKTLYGFNYVLDGETVSTGQIDEWLKTETDIAKRQKIWELSKEVGKDLKPGLVNLQRLRNETVKSLGFTDYFSYQVSEYGMTTEEMMTMCKQLIKDIWPLYRELHTFMRYELAAKYGKEVPEMIPAHWFPNRWGQEASSLVDVQGIDLDKILEEKGSEYLVRQAERFYLSLGFDSLPNSFYEKGDMYPLPKDAKHKKNSHASAWHMDLQQDVRCLMSVKPTAEYYATTHHELGHIYYYLEYANPNVPMVLREGANRAFHEGVGSLMGLAAMQKPFLAELGLIEPDVKTDDMQMLLKEALDFAIVIPWGAGVMTHFEQALYNENLPENEFNKKWWELKEKYQGIVAPTERGEEYCDAASKTHINNDAAQYYDYALSYAILFQLHDHIAKNILKEDPHATNYFGNKDAGQFLQGILSVGGTRDWRELLKEATGQELNAKAMVAYFEPLMGHLQKINEGRKYTLPETID